MQSSGETRRGRPWTFWRKAFWTRPAFFVAYAAIALAAFPFVARVGVQAWAGAQALHTHRVCGPGIHDRCLEPLEGRLEGPDSDMTSANSSWTLRRGQREVDGFAVGPRGSERLSALGSSDVTALAYDGQVLVVEVPDGTEVRTTLAGVPGVVQQLCLSLLALGVAAVLFRYGRKKRRVWGSWWAVEGPEVNPGDLAVMMVVFPAAATFLAMNFSIPWWLGVVGSVPFVVWAAWRMRQPDYGSDTPVGRHAADSLRP